jgi:alpha-glucosidase (family GH31 glycosyl hydrolase)
MPLVGSDICGYYGNTTAELCARWYTVGAFYPFSRNYNDWGLNSQEPWMFQSRYEASVSYFDIIKKAMYTKFHMIRYYYSEMIWLSVDGGAFFKPLFMEFPDDNMALDASQENNVMLGAALKLSVNSNMLN